MKAKILLIIPILLVVLASGCASNSWVTTQTPNGSDSGNQQNCRYVDEPYTESEPYEVQVPYQDTEYYTAYLDNVVLSATHSEDWNFEVGYFERGNVTIKNTDTEAGWFNVKFMWRTLHRGSNVTVRHYIEPDEAVSFISTFDKSMGEDITFTYTCISDPVTKSRLVTKYRTETRYRDVQKTRQVWKCD